MLQFYDIKGPGVALAFAALAGYASANTTVAQTCDLTNGYAAPAAAFASEVEACLATERSHLRTDIETDIRTLTERARAKLNLDAFDQRASLDAAARAHALDMAVRGYAAHADLEGRDHLDRIQTLDRSVLIGASGANVAAGVLEDAATAFNALIGDEENRKNLTRDAFTHMGVGAAQDANGRLYVVQIFAQIDGELTTPLPAELPPIASLRARFVETGFQPVGWELRDTDGRLLRRGYGDQVRIDLAPSQTAELIIEVSLQPGLTYALKGPRVSGG